MLRIALLILLNALAVSSGGVAAQEGSSDAQPPSAASASPEMKSRALVRLGDLYLHGEQVPQDLEKAFAFYQQAAEAGSQSARLRTGEMLARGMGVNQDFKRGRQIVREIAYAGSVRAWLSLGDIHSLGDAGPMTPDLAIEIYEYAASRGSVQAMQRLGDIYRHGKFDSPQSVKAASYYRNAADMGDAYALLSLGRLYIEGLARKAGSPAEGMRLLKEARRAGAAEATVSISDGYFYGYGVRRNAKKALAILSEAMKKGNILATKRLIAAYRDGKRDGRLRLVKKSPHKARELLRKNANKFSSAEIVYEQFLMESASARAEFYRALYRRLRKFLSRDQYRLFRDLRRVNPNLYVFALQSRLAELKAFKGKATGYLNWSTTLAIHDYCRRTAPLYICRKGPMSGPSAKILSFAFREPPQNYAEAVKRYYLAAEQGDAEAQFKLGLLYGNGQGVPQDDAEAVKWWRKAAEENNVDAQRNLGWMYEYGRGVTQDRVEAATWYRKAAEQGDAISQATLALNYADGDGVPKDIVLAYMWSSLAAASGRDSYADFRELLEKRMTPDQIVEAQLMARGWIAQHQQ